MTVLLFVKRLLTALVLLAVLFVGLRTVALGIGGGVAAANATAALQAQGGGPKDFNAGFAVGAKAGAEFSAQNGQTIGLAALAVATLTALWLSYGGVLPWCRDEAPPSLPRKRFG